MTRLHARDPEERWKGLDAFETVYAAAELDRASRLWTHPGLRRLLDRIHPWIARYRQPLLHFELHRLVGSLIRAGAGRLRM